MRPCTFCEDLIDSGAFVINALLPQPGALAGQEAIMCERCFRFCGEPSPHNADAIYLHISTPSVLDGIRFTTAEAFARAVPLDSVRMLPGHNPGSVGIVARTAKAGHGAWTQVQPLPDTRQPAACFVCDGCDAYFGEGQRRFRCADCFDFDLCEACFYARSHPAEHAFYVLCRGVHLPCRGLLPDRTSFEVVPLARLSRDEPHLFAQIEELDRLCFGDHAWPIAQVERFAHGEHHHSDAIVARRKDAYGRTETALAALVLYRYSPAERSVLIASLAVAPSWQGKGMGDMCLSHVFVRARAMGLQCATLQVNPTNDRALALYLKRGFHVVDLLEHYYGLDQPGYLMEAPL
jgi:ribosomal protein S18 acetylase RimI-like enzyme